MSDVRRSRRQGRSSPADGPAPASASAATVAARANVLRRLELDVTRRLDGLIAGDHRATNHGPGSEPADARPYAPGDDARRIDWNLSARALGPHVRTTEADRELETWIVADRSASLDFGTTEREKRDVVLGSVAAFGSLSLRGGNRLGVLACGGDQLLRFPARPGRSALFGALAALYDTPRRDQGAAPAASLRAALSSLERTQARRGRIVVVTDFLDPSEWAPPLARLALRHHLFAVHVTDPRELELPAVGMLSLVDVETGQHLHVQTNSPTLRQKYAAAAGARHERIRLTLRTAGADYLAVSTHRDWVVDIARFVGGRRAERVAPTGADRRAPNLAMLGSR